MPKDILLDADFDLLVKDGDFGSGDSTQQNKQAIIVAAKGDYRQFPFVGVSIVTFINDDNFGDAKAEIQRQFELDGMIVKSLKLFDDGSIQEDATYQE